MIYWIKWQTRVPTVFIEVSVFSSVPISFLQAVNDIITAVKIMNFNIFFIFIRLLIEWSICLIF